MGSSVPTAVISTSNAAWKMLNGVVCIYKPLDWGFKKVLKEIRNKLLQDLNRMEPLPRKEIVELRRVGPEDEVNHRIPLENEKVVGVIEDGRKRIEIVKGLGYADHPLVTGSNFLEKDIKIVGTGKTIKEASGVHLYGINKGILTAQRIFHSRWLRTYLISGQFGIATDTFFHTGRIQEKATYGSIKRQKLENFLASMQSSHQRLSFLASGVPLESQRAYELASEGLVRPTTASASVVVSMKVTEFDLPNFTIEVKAINEDAEYMMRIIHEIGIKLRSVATCTKLLCTNVGPFGIDDALLVKHWNVQNFLDCMKKSRNILKGFNLEELDAWIDKPEVKESING